MTSTASACVLGVFAGGRARRMHGRDKAELPAPQGGVTLLQRWVELAGQLGLPVVVVGGRTRAGLVTLADAPAGIGPLGGLGALLAHAAPRSALAVACDMPYVELALLSRLMTHASPAAVLAPREADGGKWQPMFARYDPAQVMPALSRSLAAGDRSFQQLFARLEVEELPLTAAERVGLKDWDEPADVGW